MTVSQGRHWRMEKCTSQTDFMFPQHGLTGDWSGSHFKTTLMKGLTEAKHIRHRFTVSCCPWSNCKVERWCKEVLRIARALLPEWKLAVGQWPAMIDAIQKIINQSPKERLGILGAWKLRCPMKWFSGLHHLQCWSVLHHYARIKTSERLMRSVVRKVWTSEVCITHCNRCIRKYWNKIDHD